MADVTVDAAYASVVEDDGQLFIGFAEGEDADEAYILFRQPVGGGPIWFEVTDETFGAEDAVETVEFGPAGIEITIAAGKVAAFGYVRHVSVRIGPDCECAPEAMVALRQMLG